MYIGKWYYSQAVTWTARKQNFVEEKFEKIKKISKNFKKVLKNS